MARRRLAPLAGTARRHAAAHGSARPRAPALERPGLPPALPLLAAHLPRDLQPPVGAGVVRHRVHGAVTVVRGERTGPRTQRDRAPGRSRAPAPGRADPAVGGARCPGPLPRQGNSLSHRLARDAGGAAGVASLVAPFTPPRSGSGAHPPAGAAREPLTR